MISLDFGNSLRIFQDNGEWRLNGCGRIYPLVVKSDFKRVVSLLESPYQVIREILGDGFPYVRVVEAGLNSGSDYWVELALCWMKKMPQKDLNELRVGVNGLLAERLISKENSEILRKIYDQNK